MQTYESMSVFDYRENTDSICVTNVSMVGAPVPEEGAGVRSVFEETQAALLPIHPHGEVPVTLALPVVDYPVGGRLQYFAEQWALIQADQWVIDVVTNGYKLEFTDVPPLTEVIRVTPLPKDVHLRELLLNEVQSLIQKNAVRLIKPPYEIGFWATFFLAPKKTGDWRPILNLKPVNAFIRPKRFRMQCLSLLLKGDIKGKWATSLDLKDAYLHIPIHRQDRKWLRFKVNGQAFEFKCLPFGLSTAPRVFTRVTQELGAFVRSLGVQIYMYLDDWIILSLTQAEAERDLKFMCETIERLGFVINKAKSCLIPTQKPTFLGADIELDSGRVFPTDNRILNLISCVIFLMSMGEAPAIVWLKVLGLMASMVDLVPWCRFHMRPLQLHLMYHYRPALHNIQKSVPMSDIVRGH